jgi:hypothetical protein
MIVLFFWERNEGQKTEKGNEPISPDDNVKINGTTDNRIAFKLEVNWLPKN